MINVFLIYITCLLVLLTVLIRNFRSVNQYEAEVKRFLKLKGRQLSFDFNICMDYYNCNQEPIFCANRMIEEASKRCSTH